MFKSILVKIVIILVMIAAPYVSGKAFYEYYNVAILKHEPSYPFGKEVTDTMKIKDISYLSSYEKEMLTIGFICLALAVIVYLGMLIKSLFRLVFIAAILFVGYYIYIRFLK